MPDIGEFLTINKAAKLLKVSKTSTPSNGKSMHRYKAKSPFRKGPQPRSLRLALSRGQTTNAHQWLIDITLVKE